MSNATLRVEPTECPECHAPIYDDPLNVLFVPQEPKRIIFECGCIVTYHDSPPCGVVVDVPCPKSHSAQVEKVIQNYESGQNIFRRPSVERLIEEVLQLRATLRTQAAQGDATVGDSEHNATLEKYQSDLDKLAAALGHWGNLETSGGFVETVCAHIRHMRHEIIGLADKGIISIGRAGEIMGLTVSQTREEMRKYAAAQAGKGRE